jgi:pyrroline-5-carboxylate reductase
MNTSHRIELDTPVEGVEGIALHNQALAPPDDPVGVVTPQPSSHRAFGEGMTVWTAAPKVGAQQRTWASLILGPLDRALYVDSESYLDMATAISGTGPAYVFLMMEAMIAAGVHPGLSRRIAEELVI